MFSEEDIQKIDSYLHEKFDIVFDFDFNGLILLFGGAVKDLIMDQPVNDLDFLLLTQEEPNLEYFFKKNGICPKLNKFIGYTFIYNDIKIDISSSNDLYYAGNLNTDMLFYDIKNKDLIPIGIKYAVSEKQIIDNYYQGYFKTQRRIKKAKQFIKYMSKNDKRIKVKYKYNIFFKLLIALIMRPYKVFKFFYRGKKYAK